MADDIVQDSGELLKLSEAARELGITNDLEMIELVRQRKIEAIRMPDRTYRITKDAINQYLAPVRKSSPESKIRSPESKHLAKGEYVIPPRHRWQLPTESLVDLQDRFLNAVRTVTPEVLVNLAAEPLATYRELVAQNHPTHLINEWMAAIGMQTWAVKWHLDAEWCKWRATHTLENWHRDPQLLTKDLEWAPRPARMVQTVWSHQDDLSLPDYWNPEVTSEPAIRAEIDSAIARIKAMALEKGLIAPKEVRRQEHFDGAVLYQVCGQSYEQIAARERSKGKSAKGPPKPRKRTRKYEDERIHSPSTFTAKAAGIAVRKIVGVLGFPPPTGN